MTICQTKWSLSLSCFMLSPPPCIHPHSVCLCREFSLRFEVLGQLYWGNKGPKERGPIAFEKNVHTQERGISRISKRNTVETNDKYTKYTSVFITVCKHFVLHFKNATIKLLAHVCTKQINCNACYKALFVKIQTLIPGERKGKRVNIVT